MLEIFRRARRSQSGRAQFLRFACVGATVALVDAGGLCLLMDGLGWAAFAGRLVSFPASMVCGYFLNRSFTFREAGGPALGQGLRFLSVQSLGGALNYSVFSAILVAAAEAAQGYLVPVAAVWAGGVAGMVFNFFVSRKLVFAVDS